MNELRKAALTTGPLNPREVCDPHGVNTVNIIVITIVRRGLLHISR